MTEICTATARTGERCQQPSIHGGRVCRYHGGAAPQVKAAAAARWSTPLIPKAVRRIERLIDDDKCPTTALGASKFTIEQEYGRSAESVSMDLSGQIDVVGVLRQRLSRRGETDETGEEMRVSQGRVPEEPGD